MNNSESRILPWHHPRIPQVRPWYVGFPLMCAGLISSKKPAIRCLISKVSKTPVYNHKTISRPGGFAWGKSVLRKQVIVFKNARGEYLAVLFKDNGFDVPLSFLSS